MALIKHMTSWASWVNGGAASKQTPPPPHLTGWGGRNGDLLRPLLTSFPVFSIRARHGLPERSHGPRRASALITAQLAGGKPRPLTFSCPSRGRLRFSRCRVDDFNTSLIFRRRGFLDRTRASRKELPPRRRGHPGTRRPRPRWRPRGTDRCKEAAPPTSAPPTSGGRLLKTLPD